MNRNRLWTAAIVLLTAQIAFAQARPKQTDVEVDGMTGPVKTVAVSVATAGGKAEPVEASSYDRDGVLVDRVSYIDGEEAGRLTFTYDAVGRHIKSTTPMGLAYGVRTTRLQPHDTIMTRPVQGPDGKFEFVVVRNYDSAGRVIGEATYPGSDPTKAQVLARTIYRYDAQGRLGELSHFVGQPGLLVDKEVYTYDPENRIIEAIRYRQSNQLPTKRTFAYDFDERGNWIKRIETTTLNGQQLVTITTREIAYW